MPHRKEFAQLLTFLSVERTRLVWLYAEALRLEQEGRHHQCDRLRAVERVLLVSMASARRKARLGGVDERELQALEEDFGVSRRWIVHGNVEALKAGIEAHCRGEE